MEQSDQSAPSGMPFWTGLLIAINLLVFAGLAYAQGSLDIKARAIFDWGGLVPLDRMPGEYWRFLSAGFLHWGAMHLAANMICLLAWGVPLERRYGGLPMLILFIGSILAGSCASVLMHDKLFISAGASGGVSGLLGALFMLQLLREIRLPASFFVINFALNIGMALFFGGIDWQAHLGGFLGGMALTLILRMFRILPSMKWG